MHTASTSIPPLYEATCLAHVIEAVSLRLRTATGRDLLVSYGCLGADLTPCQLRTALINASADTSGTLWGSVPHVDVVGGLSHVGGGLYQRSSFKIDERWLVSGLPLDRLRAVVSQPCPLPIDEDGFGIVLKPDIDLGVTAVCVRAEQRSPSCHLDEVATWVLATTLVAELLDGIDADHSRPSPRGQSAHPANGQ